MPIEGNRNHPLGRKRGWTDQYLGDKLPSPAPVGRPPRRVGAQGQPERSRATLADAEPTVALQTLRLHSTEAIDRMARDLAGLPASLTPTQRRRLRIIAHELLRRAKRPATQTQKET